MLNYTEFPKIDAHIHVNFKDEVYLEKAKAHQVHLITINTDVAHFPTVDQQEAVALYFQQIAPQSFSYISSFSMQGWEEKDWLAKTKNNILNAVKNGAVGLKLWKNIGMEIRKKNGDFLMIDDVFFEPFFEFISEHNLTILAHLGEPKNCWLPLEEMTTHRNRLYYSRFPEFHMYLHPEYPSYAQHIQSRDHILQRYPDIKFIGAHLGSLESDYKELALRFDAYPNFHVDISSRLNHLQLQAIQDHAGVRNFFIQYADRLMYGTDAIDNLEKMERSYLNDWLFFTSDTWMSNEEIEGQFKGISLPEAVLKKLYYNNALNYYPALRTRLDYI